jgi:hypothetical protein
MVENRWKPGGQSPHRVENLPDVVKTAPDRVPRRGVGAPDGLGREPLYTEPPRDVAHPELSAAARRSTWPAPTDEGVEGCDPRAATNHG